MKIGVIADTHIPIRVDDLPREIYKNFKGLDLILHAGDLVEIEVLDKLKTLSKKVKAVLGNMDSPGLAKVLPTKEIIAVGKHRIGLIHGWGPPNKLMELVENEFMKSRVDVIVFGHSHFPVNEIRDGVLFFNPGSPTDKHFSPYNSYGILEIDDIIKGEIIKL